jgi:hypothetical protein
MRAFENRLRVLQGHVLQSPIALDREALVYAGASSDDDALMSFRSKYATKPEGWHFPCEGKGGGEGEGETLIICPRQDHNYAY